MRNSVLALVFLGASLFAISCEREKTPAATIDDAAFLCDGLLGEDRGTGEQIPYVGFLADDGSILRIPVLSYEEARDHFMSLTHEDASVETSGQNIIWHLKSQEGDSEGDAVLSPGTGKGVIGLLSLPQSCGTLSQVQYRDRSTMLVAVNPDVQEDLEDNYYYGAIVDIADHGCGSGKFVVLREYNFDNGTAGMAIRLDSRQYHISRDSDQEHAIASRSSCLATLRAAGSILTADSRILSKQLANAGSKSSWNDHFYSNDRQWTGLHYYYNLWDGDYDTIGPFRDLTFYEAWVYYFVPEGDHLKFW